MAKIKKQYGLAVGIAMVVGIVIGSGVFVKAGKVLALTGGQLWLSLLAWLVGGIIMITSGYCFAVFATKVKRYNGVVDYVEMSAGKRVAYHLSWLMNTLYYPTVASIVAFLASNYFCALIGVSIPLWAVFLIAFGFVTGFAVLNYFSPKIAGHFQVSATVVKLIPIIFVAVVGLFASLIKDCAGIGNAFSVAAHSYTDSSNVLHEVTTDFGSAVRTTAFAYEGWVCATIINAELKDSDKNLPRALTGGTIAIVIFYIIYYIGLSSIVGNQAAFAEDSNAPLVAFTKIMSNVGGKVFCVFIIISCLGTVNGVMMSTSRGLYTISCRGQGPAPEKFSKVNKDGMSLASCAFGYYFTVLLLGIWYLAISGVPFFEHLGSMDEIVCALIYGTFIIMFVHLMKNFTDLPKFKRWVMPIIAIVGCSFFVLVGTGLFQFFDELIVAAINSRAVDWNKATSSLIAFAVWLVLFLVINVPSIFFYRPDAKGDVDKAGFVEGE